MTRSRKRRAALLLCLLCAALFQAAPAEEAIPPADSPAAEETAGDGQPESAAEEAEGGEQEQPGEAGEAGKGGRPSGGGRRSGRSGGSSGITPGKALISTHAKGTGAELRHGAVALTAAEEDMQALVLGGEELALSCGGFGFSASVEEDVLVLRSEEGDAWAMTMDVLRTLNRSGIRRLRLIGPAGETALDTAMELTGALYGRERARGFVSADFLLLRREGEWEVRVDSRTYRLAGSELC